jgi:hypothetical protein
MRMATEHAYEPYYALRHFSSTFCPIHSLRVNYCSQWCANQRAEFLQLQYDYEQYWISWERRRVIELTYAGSSRSPIPLR